MSRLSAGNFFWSSGEEKRREGMGTKDLGGEGEEELESGRGSEFRAFMSVSISISKFLSSIPAYHDTVVAFVSSFSSLYIYIFIYLS